MTNLTSRGQNTCSTCPFSSYSASRSSFSNLLSSQPSGYGKVYLSKSTPDKSNVAIKRVPYLTTKDRRKALQEVRFLRYCGHHPNIVGIHRAHLVKEEIWIVMEYLEGATLMQAVAVHKFSELQIAYIARYMLKAILYLHENQIAHRDLKSSNVILTSSGSVKLIDLGLCTDISQGQVTHMVGSVRFSKFLLYVLRFNDLNF